MENDRVSFVEIDGEQIGLMLNTRATKKIAARYGELSGIDQALDGTADFDKAFDESLWLIALLANSYVEY